MQQSKKSKDIKSHVFWILKKKRKNIKKVKVIICIVLETIQSVKRVF